MAAEWFYQAKGQQSGPVASAELRRLADTGVLTPDALVCRATATGMADCRWIRAAKVQGLFQLSDPPSTKAVRHVEGKPISRAAVSSAEKRLQSPPSPPPLPPSSPPVLSDSPRQRRVSLLAVALAAGGVAVVLLAYAAYMVGLVEWLIIAVIIGSFGFGLYQLGKSLLAGSSMAGEERVRPWIRYWARFLDTYTAVLVMGFIVGVVHPAAEWNELLFGMALLFAYCYIIEPILFGIFGTTPGKALLAIEVRTQSGDWLSFGQAMKRSLSVWFYGWGMGIPLVLLFTLCRAYGNLTQKKITTWDRRGNFHVSHRRIGAVRGTIATVLIVGLFGLFVMLKEATERHDRDQILRDLAPLLDSRALRQADRLDPKDAEAYFNRGAAYVNKGEFDKAIIDYTEAIRINPKCAKAYCYRGAMYLAKDDFDRAIADCNEAIRFDPKFGLAYASRGAAYALQGDYDKAIADSNKAIRFDPKLAIAFGARGIAYAAQGHYDKAIADCSVAIRLKPAQAEVYWGRGLAYAGKGDENAAITDYTEAIRLKPNFPEAYFLRGTIYVGRSEHDRAIADLNEAIRLNPEQAEAYIVRSAAYSGKGDHAKVIADCNDAIRLDSMCAQAYVFRGIAYLAKGHYDEAIADLSEAIRLNPKDATAHYVRAGTYQKKGDLDNAKRDFEEATRLGCEAPPGVVASVTKDAAVVSAIHEAVRAKDKQAVRALVQKNPACLSEMEGDSSGFTPLHTACERGFQEMADLLLALGADVNVRARNGETPLITAVAERGEGNMELALFFIARGADVKAASHDGWTALHYAANENMPALAQALIDKGASMDAITVEDETPLDVALKQHSREVVQVLLKNGAEIRDRREDGKTQR